MNEHITEVTVRARFETAHRLPQLAGKCVNLHGHSWQAWATLSGPVDPNTGVLVDFSAIKAAIQDWIDARFDHATMLGAADSLLGAFIAYALKHFVFDEDPPSIGLRWPTVENVAEVIRRVAVDAAAGLPGVRVSRVEVAETENNRATACERAA